MTSASSAGVISGLGANAPIPPVFGPRSPSKIRLWSWALPSGIARRPSASAKNDTSGPTRHSSITRREPAFPNARSSMAARTAVSASARSAATTTPLPPARPSALTTTGKPKWSPATAASADSAVSHTRYRAVGIPAASMNFFENTFDVSSAAALLGGPTMDRPAARKTSARPRSRAASGPTTVRSMPSRPASASMACGSRGSTGKHWAIEAIPEFPGAQTTRDTSGSRASRQVKACSRPPPPTTRTFMTGILCGSAPW